MAVDAAVKVGSSHPEITPPSNFHHLRDTTMRRGRHYILRNTDGIEITIAEAKAIITERYTVPENIRAGRRANRSQLVA